MTGVYWAWYDPRMSEEARPAFAFPTDLTPQQKKVRTLIRETPVGGLAAIGFGGAVGGGKGCRIPNRAAPSYNEAMETTIATPKGFKLAGDIRLGDEVCNPDGTTATVVGLFPRGLQQFYRVTFQDGASVECDSDHLWGVRDRNVRKRRKVPLGPIPDGLTQAEDWNYRYFQRYTVMPTSLLYERIQAGHNLAVPLTAPVAFTMPPLRWPTLPPYTMGVLLGDGHFGASRVAWSKPDPEIVPLVAEEVAHLGLVVSDMTDGSAHSLIAPVGSGVASPISYVERVGLAGTRSATKFIPNRYKYAPAGDRLLLVNGLLDTDGYVDERGHVEYVTVSQQLALDMQWMLRSLGYTASITEKAEPKYTHKGEARTGQKAYRLYVRGNNMPALFRLPRKKDRCRERIGVGSGANGHDLWADNPIVSIEKTVVDECMCISVDNPNQLYITDDFIVTHNTALLVRMAYELSILYPGNRGMVGRDEFNKLETTTLEMFDEMVPPDLVIRRNNAPPVYRDIRLAHWPDRAGKPFTDPKRQTPLFSRVYFRGLANWKSLGSEAFGFAMIDEASEVPDMAAVNLILRLRHRLPRFVEERLAKQGEGLRYIFLAASNPWPNTFFEKWFWRGEADEVVQATKGRVQVHFVPSRIRDNPYLPENYEETARAFLRASGHGAFSDRMVDGRFDVFEGRVYEHFDPHTHRLDALDSDLLKKDEKGSLPYKAVYGGLDFGGESETSHFTAGCIAVMTWSNRLIFVEGFKYRGADVYSKQLAWMMAMQHKWAAPIGKKVHWCADGSQRVGINAWQEQGFWITPSERGPGSVEEGIKKVAGRLEKDGAGIPAIKYLAAFAEFEDAMRRYARDPETMQIVKKDDDMADCIRYTVHVVDQFTGDPNVLLRNNLAVVQ